MSYRATCQRKARPTSHRRSAATLLLRQNETARRTTGAGCDQHVFDVLDLIARRAANLAHGLGDAVHTVARRRLRLSLPKGAMARPRRCNCTRTASPGVAIEGSAANCDMHRLAPKSEGPAAPRPFAHPFAPPPVRPRAAPDAEHRESPRMKPRSNNSNFHANTVALFFSARRPPTTKQNLQRRVTITR